MMRYLKISVLIFLSLIVEQSKAQDLFKDLESYYSNVNSGSIAKMTIYQVDSVDHKQEPKEFVMTSGDDFFFQRLEEFDYLITSEWYLMLHRQEKTILVKKEEFDSEEVDIPNHQKVMLDSIRNKIKTYTYLGNKSGEKQYEVIATSDNYKSIQIALDSQTNAPKRVSYSYKEIIDGQKGLEMVYDYKQELPDELSEIAYYLDVSDPKKPVLKKKFNDYQLIILNH